MRIPPMTPFPCRMVARTCRVTGRAAGRAWPEPRSERAICSRCKILGGRERSPAKRRLERLEAQRIRAPAKIKIRTTAVPAEAIRSGRPPARASGSSWPSPLAPKSRRSFRRPPAPGGTGLAAAPDSWPWQRRHRAPLPAQRRSPSPARHRWSCGPSRDGGPQHRPARRTRPVHLARAVSERSESLRDSRSLEF